MERGIGSYENGHLYKAATQKVVAKKDAQSQLAQQDQVGICIPKEKVKHLRDTEKFLRAPNLQFGKTQGPG